ncbi:MAG: T9SS type A sorting domain-containing protein [Saprospiraceae bacterium]
MPKLLLSFCLLLSIGLQSANAQDVARQWNEELLKAVRNDFARPTVHARNLFHTSFAMYDAWAAFDPEADTYFLGKTVGDYTCGFDGMPEPPDRASAQREAVSYAAFRLLRYRFRNSPNRAATWRSLDSVMFAQGYNPMYVNNAYQGGDAAALGNYIAFQVIIYGNGDGANDAADYENQYYEPLNGPLLMDEPGNPDIIDPNRWQPLSLANFIDQSGNPIPGGMQEFLGPEWGNVTPFSLTEADKQDFTRDGDTYPVYHDPGPPPLITDPATRERYQRGFEMVGIWGGLLDPNDGVTWDIGPGARGRNIDPLPDFADYYDVYNEYGGGDTTGGLSINPITNLPYAPNVVKRGDYGRVLAEFWADGPDSETPPGHWFVLINYVMDAPGFVFKWRGQGAIIDTMEYEVKSYFALGGAMHDAAISTWSIKGWYDYLRPVSAIRYMAEKGQRSDPALPRYHEHGLRLEPGFIEMIDNIGDPLAGPTGENIAEVKIWSWLGPDAIADPATDVGGVGWILAKEWWPYQRPTFVSPPFAGYVSGHSTYSRAAAEVLTSITGSRYFPGGLGTFTAEQNEFLVFEEGPSETVELQWATYQDASDEVSLSRIYGGIHPMADDIPGRKIGMLIADEAYGKAVSYFDQLEPTQVVTQAGPLVNFVARNELRTLEFSFDEPVDTLLSNNLTIIGGGQTFTPETIRWTGSQALEVDLRIGAEELNGGQATGTVVGIRDLYGNELQDSTFAFTFDTKQPSIAVSANKSFLGLSDVGSEALTVTVSFDEPMDTMGSFLWSLPSDFPAGILTSTQDGWQDESTYVIVFDVNLVSGARYEDLQLAIFTRDTFDNQPADPRTPAFLDLDFLPSSTQTLPSGGTAQLFPNPVVDQLSLKLSARVEGEVVLTDASGRIVRRMQVTGFGESWNVSTLVSGAYNATLTTKTGEQLTWRIVKR